MFGLGMGEILLIFLFALLFIGPKKLPELAKSLGKGIKEFQKAKAGLYEDVAQASKEQLNLSPVSKTTEVVVDNEKNTSGSA